MYHYVRPIEESRYPRLKGLEVASFERQLDYLTTEYTVISPFSLLDYINGDAKLPKKSCILTFDDGYRDHYQYVLPILLRRALTGIFFPSARAILERKILDVNAIHFILAETESIADLVIDINQEMHSLGIIQCEIDNFWIKYGHSTEYDGPEVSYIKKVLQFGLKDSVRKIVIKNLFIKYVGVNDSTFSDELYMSLDEVAALASSGMMIGGHGWDHVRLSLLDEKSQEFEIKKTIEFLNKLGVLTNQWVMCYPYGAYNEKTIDILKRTSCALAFTTKKGVTLPTKIDKFEIERLNTNDFPR
jgi:peptidoglycan/xylan/chitin deacetylase (PgdA/CDA1 family)